MRSRSFVLPARGKRRNRPPLGEITVNELIKESVDSKLARKAYSNTKPYARRSVDRAVWDAHYAEENRLYIEFKNDVLTELGLITRKFVDGEVIDGKDLRQFETVTHPKADKLFEMAWEDGHASGYQDVWYHAQRFIDLVLV